MASRVARSAVGATRLRPVLHCQHVLPAIPSSLTTTRSASNVPAEDPKKRAQSILDSLPGTSLASKTAILSAGAGLSIAAISNELYVLNEESIVALSLLSIFWAVGKWGGPMYKDWADGQINKMKNILNSARKDHTNAVQTRIESVKELGGVVDITKNLFAVSKVFDTVMETNDVLVHLAYAQDQETAQLEAKAFELEQKTALVHEAKSVLDSWVRYEGQVKVRQQRELADSIISKIMKELENPKTLQQILQQSVADVEKIVGSKAQ